MRILQNDIFFDFVQSPNLDYLVYVKIDLLECRLKYAIKNSTQKRFSMHRKLSVLNDFLLKNNLHHKVITKLEKNVVLLN